MNYMNRRAVAEQIFLAGVDSVLPDRFIAREVVMKGNFIYLGDHKFCLDKLGKIYVIGIGKSSARMAAELENILGNRITDGHIVVRDGYSCKLKYIKVSEVGHPLPDSNSYKAIKTLLRIAEMANTDDLVICLLSDCSSELLADFPEGTSPEEMNALINLLTNSGAGITEINAVLKHLSSIKGGQLARTVYPATLVSLILSDVPGDHLDMIASGPTTADTTTFHDAKSVLDKFNLTMSVSEGILNYLNEGERGIKPETPKTGEAVYDKTFSVIAGNGIALEEARQKSLELSLNPKILSDSLQGDVCSIADYIVETSIKIQNDKREIKPVCILCGGEVTFKMTGKEAGGTNQYLALLAATLLQNHPGITVLCAGTNGSDGNTDAAGAVVDSHTIDEALEKNIDPAKFIKSFDAYHFFRKIEGQIITGATLTNVGDIIVVIID
jgi:glycerate 2-kinase